MSTVLVHLVVLLLCLRVIHSDEVPPGHLQPLGSHMLPREILVVDSFPDALTFHYSYVKNNSPVKFKGLLKNTEVLKNWQSDDYLRDRFGNNVVTVDGFKKENRTDERKFEMKVSEFLDRYKDEDIYMISELSQEMADEWPLPSFLLCGGYTENIAFVFTWLSNGGTKSVLHSDLMENFHCVVSGMKTFVLIDKAYGDIIGPEYSSQGYFNLDVDAVDMTKYPELSNVPWYKAVIEPGDCLYLPYGWIHQVASEGRNMGINVWWIRFLFDDEDCSNVPDVQGFANVGQFQISSEIQIKGFLLDMKRQDGSIHAEDVLATQQKQTTDVSAVTLEDIIQAFEILQPGCEGILHEKQLKELPIERYKKADEFISSILQGETISETPSTGQEGEPMIPIIPPGGPPPDQEPLQEPNRPSRNEL